MYRFIVDTPETLLTSLQSSSFIEPSSDILLPRSTEQNFRAELSLVDHVFSDADGTIVVDGTTSFSTEKIELFRQLQSRGIGITVVTGKPLTEVAGLQASLPADVSLNFLCEKGAYLASFDKNGAHKKYVLSSAALETEVAALKRLVFTELAPKLEHKYGVYCGLSGSGAHTSVLGIDLFSERPPENYLELIGEARDRIKLQDQAAINQCEQAIADFVRERHPDWRVVHMGNANTEIAPGPIEKNEAIKRTHEFQKARRVLVLGDSNNDRAMFALNSEAQSKTLAHLVVSRPASGGLIDLVDSATLGMAHADPILAALIDARANS